VARVRPSFGYLHYPEELILEQITPANLSKPLGEQMTDTNPANPNKTANIWLTAKARMEAEKRLKLYDVVSHLVVIWYSLWLLCLTVFSESFQPYVGTIGIGELSTFLSASVLVLSVTNWGFKFGAKASLHRDCYLELEKLLSSAAEDKQSLYSDIKKRFPNHATFDLDTVLFRRIRIRGEKIEDNNGPAAFGFWATVFFGLTWVFEKLTLLTAFILPIIIAYLLYEY